jgi:hypothetical protein
MKYYDFYLIYRYPIPENPDTKLQKFEIYEIDINSLERDQGCPWAGFGRIPHQPTTLT